MDRTLRRHKFRRSELNAGVLCNNICDPRSKQEQRLAVIACPHDRDGFPLKSPYFSVRQYRFQAVANFNTGAMVVDGVKNQYAAIRRLAAYAPLMEQIDGVTFDIGAVERLDGHYGDLRMRFLIDLKADLVHLRDRALIQNAGKIIDVIGILQLSDGFSLGSENQQQENGGQRRPQFCAAIHAKENCTGRGEGRTIVVEDVPPREEGTKMKE